LLTFYLAILATPEAEARLKLASEIFLKQASIAEVSQKIASAVDESLSKQQKEYFLRQQLAAIQKELQTLTTPPIGVPRRAGDGESVSELDDDEQQDADDMADLRKKIEAMEQGSEERKMSVREWRRLKRIPQGSVEHGVIRTYVCLFPYLHVYRRTDSDLAGMAHIATLAQHATDSRRRPTYVRETGCRCFGIAPTFSLA
jgi:ATP-dependent Lon protease